MDRVHDAVDRGQSRSTVDRGQRARRRLTGAWALELTGDGGGGQAGRSGAREVLTGDGGVATRWRTGGNERRRLELIARTEEGAKKLGREGMRCGEGRGVSSPFYRGQGRWRGVAGGE
jgi:hypothetical protein